MRSEGIVSALSRVVEIVNKLATIAFEFAFLCSRINFVSLLMIPGRMAEESNFNSSVKQKLKTLSVPLILSILSTENSSFFKESSSLEMTYMDEA
jgi:hypothetical protein